MGFYHGLKLENFRIFGGEQNFEFAPITVLTGTNSSGKSSVSHGLRLIKNIVEDGIISQRNHDGKQIEFKLDVLFSDLNYSRIDKRISEFKNFLHKNNKNNTLKISIPLLIEDYENPVEIILNYKCINETFSKGQLIELIINDSKLNQHLIKLTLKEKEIYGKINYKLLYDQLISEIDHLNALKKNAKEYLVNRDLGINDPISRNILKNNIRKCFGAIKMKIGYDNNNDVVFQPPFEFMISETSCNFALSKNIYKKYCRMYHDLINKIKTNEQSIINVEILDSGTIDKIIDEAKKEGITFESKLNTLIFDHLTDTEFNLGTIDSNNELWTNVHGSQNFTYPSREIIDFLNKKYNNLNNNIIESNLLTPPKNVISEFGSEFFIEYSFNRIIQSIYEIKAPYFFENTNIVFDSRVFNINQNNNFIKETIKYQNIEHKFKDFVTKWLYAFGLGSDINISILENSLSINVIHSDGLYNLLDEGYGTSRIIPLLIKIFDTAISKIDSAVNYKPGITVVIEEPELGLHPKLQSLLADMFIDAYRSFNMQFIIETHSEYMVRRLQVLTAMNEISTEDTQIYYFHHPRNIPEGEQQCYPINIEADGALTKNFGSGFFDESNNLNISLYRFSKENKN